MAYEIDLPDGSRGLIHDNVPRSKSLEAAQRAYPDAFPPPPTALGQALNAPKNIFKGVGSGLVQAVGGLSSLPYAGARYFNPEMTPFAETGFGKSITSAEQSLAPTDEGLGSQFSHNGFLEVLLGGGFIGGLMFFVFVIWSGWVKVGSVCKEELGQWSFALATFILVANSQEVFITGNHFLWVLLVASLSRVKPAPVQSAETSSTPST